MGSWAANRDKGIRNYPYSLDTEVNPSTYQTLDKPGYWGVHAIGEVWAQILWVLEQRLIAKHGFSDTLIPPPADAPASLQHTFFRADKPGFVPKHGNTLIVQLVVNGMKLQPCSPSFFDARDAIIQADQVLTGGENFCDIWEGFAERGLGVDANVKGRTPWGGGVRENVSGFFSSLSRFCEGLTRYSFVGLQSPNCVWRQQRAYTYTRTRSPRLWSLRMVLTNDSSLNDTGTHTHTT